MQTVVVTTVESAALYGTSPSSISRAAKRAKVGLRREDGRLVGLLKSDLRAIKKHLFYEPGNPSFANAARRKRRESYRNASRQGAGGVRKVRSHDRKD